MGVRILHIFSPNFRQRFGGPIFDWKYAFSKWDDSEIEHLVVDYDQNRPLSALDAFAFKISHSQIKTTRWQRFLWIFKLNFILFKFRNSYDILHFHILLWGCLIAVTWAKWHNIPTVYQSVLLDSDTPGAIAQQKMGKLKVNLLKKFTGILAISDALAEDYLANGFSSDQVFTLMNSVDTDLFKPATSHGEKLQLKKHFNLPEDSLLLLFVGSLIRRKGVDHLVQAFIKAHHYNPKAHLWLIGPQNIAENPSLDESFVFKIKQLVAIAGLENAVTFAGLVAGRETLSEVYRTADAFVFPSRKEGLPNVVLEAMASGLPVIVSDLPGLKNVVSPCKTGVVIPIGDIDALENAIVALVSSKTGKNTLGEAARAYIFENHGFGAWQAELVRLYKKLLSQNQQYLPVEE